MSSIYANVRDLKLNCSDKMQKLWFSFIYGCLTLMP